MEKKIVKVHFSDKCIFGITTNRTSKSLVKGEEKTIIEIKPLNEFKDIEHVEFFRELTEVSFDVKRTKDIHVFKNGVFHYMDLTQYKVKKKLKFS